MYIVYRRHTYLCGTKAAQLAIIPYREGDICESHIGIIGKPLSNFDTESLTEINNDDDDEEDDDDDRAKYVCDNSLFVV